MKMMTIDSRVVLDEHGRPILQHTFNIAEGKTKVQVVIPCSEHGIAVPGEGYTVQDFGSPRKLKSPEEVRTYAGILVIVGHLMEAPALAIHTWPPDVELPVHVKVTLPPNPRIICFDPQNGLPVLWPSPDA